MDMKLGHLAARHEQPASIKFSRPLVLMPELFTTISHLSLLSGYFTDLGWEVYSLDLYVGLPSRSKLDALVATAADAIRALDRDAILIGHGFGGWLALRLAEEAATTVAVALAPSIPGLRSPLISGWRNRIALRTGAPLRPPSGRMLFESVADADPFQREKIIRTLVPHHAAFTEELARQTVGVQRKVGLPFSPHGSPAETAERSQGIQRQREGDGHDKAKLIIAGDSDIFAPREQVSSFASAIDAELSLLQGRGHWLIGGRVLERTVSAIQRFLVKALGEDLLLLYSNRSDY